MEDVSWKPITKILFRFSFIYFFLVTYDCFINLFYLSPFPIHVTFIENTILPWMGKYILHLDHEMSAKMTGSGDKTIHFVALLFNCGVAFVGCIVWSLLDRKRKGYPSLSWFLRVSCRYYLAYYMMCYGFVKVFKTQFPFPSLTHLVTPLGEMSPMGLVWRFMGYSAGYNFFTGLGEVVGGILLLFRRTTTLGALLLIAVMSNVVVLNFCYDIPVKIRSVSLLIFAMGLVFPDFKRLIQLLILNQPVFPANLGVEVQSRFFRWGRFSCKAAFLIFIVGYSGWSRWIRYKDYFLTPNPPLYGIYEVTAFEENGTLLQPLLTEEHYWRYFVVDRFGAMVRMIDGKKLGFGFEVDQENSTVTLKRTEEEHQLAFEEEAGQLILMGEFDGKEVFVAMTKKDPNDFLLVQRGFHWINETPFNR